MKTFSNNFLLDFANRFKRTIVMSKSVSMLRVRDTYAGVTYAETRSRGTTRICVSRERRSAALGWLLAALVGAAAVAFGATDSHATLALAFVVMTAALGLQAWLARAPIELAIVHGVGCVLVLFFEFRSMVVVDSLFVSFEPFV